MQYWSTQTSYGRVRVPICFPKSFAERFSNCELSFNYTEKWLTDLKSARKIDLGTTLKFFKILKNDFFAVVPINT